MGHTCVPGPGSSGGGAIEKMVSTNTPLKARVPHSTPPRDFRDGDVFLGNDLFLKESKKEILGVNAQKIPCHPRETVARALSFVLEGVAVTVVLN